VAYKNQEPGAGFEVIERVYADNHSWFFLNWLTGTEIVIALENL